MSSYAAKLFWPVVSDTTIAACAGPAPISSILPKLGVEKQSEKTKKHFGNSMVNNGKHPQTYNFHLVLHHAQQPKQCLKT